MTKAERPAHESTQARTGKDVRLRGTAYHEAGHAVAAFWYGLSGREVSVIPDPAEGTLGHCGSRFPKSMAPDVEVTPATQRRLEAHIVSLFAGGLARRKYLGFRRHNFWGSRADLSAAFGAAMYVCGGDRECEAYLRWLWIRTQGFVGRPGVWACVEAVANALLAQRTLTWAEVRSAIREAQGIPDLALTEEQGGHRADGAIRAT